MDTPENLAEMIEKLKVNIVLMKAYLALHLNLYDELQLQIKLGNFN